jgi:mono/diheme cytochrome c family protein
MMISIAFRCVSVAAIFSAVPGLSAQEVDSNFVSLGCAACHDPDGGGNALGPNIATGELPLAGFITYVRNPTGTMLAYSEETVSDEALSEIHAALEPVDGVAKLSGDAERGGRLYRQTGCYQCHANEGQGGAQGPRVGPDTLTLARFTWYIRNPGGSMPPYTDAVMSDQELADIRAFLMERPEPPTVDRIPLLAP